MIDVLVVLVAVAVSAITLTLSGMMLRNSPKWLNSRRKLSPLIVNKNSCSMMQTIQYSYSYTIGHGVVHGIGSLPLLNAVGFINNESN